MTVLEVLTDQTMNVVCLSESSPYKYMVIVRVGNTKNPDRQSFIRISSRTNCQYFYDQITSFIDLDNPDKVKCAIGKLDVGLIPSWAVKAVGSIKRWFGLVADGVILRGIFILQNNKTIEDEITGQVTDLAGRFEIRETGITGKWQEVIDASNSVSQSEQSVTKMVGDFQVTARHLAAEFSKTVETSTTDATGAITTATQTATSSLNRTAEQLTDSFEQSFTDANGEITQKIKTEVTQNAKQWKVEVMGSDAHGNPNTVLAAINADESGVKIKGNKVQITGMLLAQIINADGLAIGNKSICLNKDGSGYLANGGIRWDEYGNTIVDGNTILEGFSNGGYLGTKIEIISPTKYKHSVGERSCYHESLVLNVLHEEDYFVLPGNDNIWMGRILRVFNFSPDLSLNILGCTKRIPPKGVGTFLGGARVSETSQFMAWYLIGISEGIQVMGTDIY